MARLIMILLRNLFRDHNHFLSMFLRMAAVSIRRIAPPTDASVLCDKIMSCIVYNFFHYTS